MLQMMKKQIFNSFGLSTLEEYGKENEFQINLIVKRCSIYLLLYNFD